MEIVGIDETKVKAISEKKKESDWIKKFRLESYKNFCNIDMPSFGPNINLNFDDVIYYKSNDRDEAIQNDWNSVLKPVVDELDAVKAVLGGEFVQLGHGAPPQVVVAL